MDLSTHGSGSGSGCAGYSSRLCTLLKRLSSFREFSAFMLLNLRMIFGVDCASLARHKGCWMILQQHRHSVGQDRLAVFGARVCFLRPRRKQSLILLVSKYLRRRAFKKGTLFERIIGTMIFFGEDNYRGTESSGRLIRKNVFLIRKVTFDSISRLFS